MDIGSICEMSHRERSSWNENMSLRQIASQSLFNYVVALRDPRRPHEFLTNRINNGIFHGQKYLLPLVEGTRSVICAIILEITGIMVKTCQKT
uniref:Uncharacterized protein n=1 Tax=Romanomermis culicivorax TaxID=13658 RepID=A0A915I870_ROMCU